MSVVVRGVEINTVNHRAPVIEIPPGTHSARIENNVFKNQVTPTRAVVALVVLLVYAASRR